MNWIIFIVIGVVVLYLIFVKFGRIGFWKKVSKNPDLAYKLFVQKPDWFVVDGITNHNPPSDRSNWMGPFRLHVPNLNQTVVIFGKKERLEVAENEILKHLNEDSNITRST